MTERDTDQVLIERVQNGDKQVFNLLVIKYQRKLNRLLSRFIRDPAELEDITQEAFIKAYRALPQFRGDSAFYTWLYRIAINTAKNHLVSSGRKLPTFSEKLSEEEENQDDGRAVADLQTPELQLQSKQVGETLEVALATLPADLRQAINLRELEGLSYTEIAEIMECPIGTVRSRIFRAREAIAAHLRPLLGTNTETRW